MSLKEARVPDIGGYADVPVIEVLVSPGDTVSKDQGLVTLESDKATMEVPAPFAGVVREIKVKLGDEVAEGSVVALIEEAASGTAEAAPAAAAKEEKAPAAAAAAPPPKKEAPAAPAAAPAAPDADSAGPRTPPVVFDADAVMPDKVPYATPAIRLFARELGVDLMQVRGSGRDGRILREDVQNFVKSALSGGITSSAPAAGGGLNLLPWPKVDFAKFGEVESVALSRI